MSDLFKILKVLVILALMLVIPISLIIIDYNMDVQRYPRGKVPFSMDITPSVPSVIIKYGEVDVRTTVLLNVQRESIDANASVIISIFMEDVYDKIRNGEMSRSQTAALILYKEVEAQSVDVTLDKAGSLIIEFYSLNPKSIIHLTGKYEIVQIPYYMRRGLDLFTKITLYLLFIFWLIPMIKRKYSIHVAKRNRIIKLEREEEEFYRKLKRN